MCDDDEKINPWVSKAEDWIGETFEYNMADSMRWIAEKLDFIGQQMKAANQLENLRMQHEGILPYGTSLKPHWGELLYPKPQSEYDFIKRPLPNSKPPVPINREQPALRCIPSPPRIGWVYVLKYGEHYKIGMTKDIKCRFSSIGLAMPEKPKLILTIESQNYENLEKHLHAMFASKRVNGEWFSLDEGDIETILELKGAKRAND